MQISLIFFCALGKFYIFVVNMRIRRADKSKMITAERLGLVVLACVAVTVGCLMGADSCSRPLEQPHAQMITSDSTGVDTVAAPAPDGRKINKRATRKGKEKKKVEPRSRDYLNEPAR